MNKKTTSKKKEDKAPETETAEETIDNVEVVEETEEVIEQTAEETLEFWKEQAMRQAAELENFRKRMTKEKSEAIVYANQRLIEALLPVLDNFEMGMQAAQGDESSMIYQGMIMVQKQLETFLEDLGVVTIETKVGDIFNTEIHEAMSQEESQEIAPEHIVRVYRKGYKLGGRLLRPASVIVAKVVEAQ